MNRLSRILIELALEEDLRDAGDVTGAHFIDVDQRSTGRIVSRGEAVISGHEVAAAVCASLDDSLSYRVIREDGERVNPGEAVAEMAGPTRSLLAVERTLLNFLQRLSGVATVTRRFVDRISHTSAGLLDTRKTTPGWRELEKRAVVHGGGANHRRGLYDAIMIKDNHLAADLEAGRLRDRVAGVRAMHPELKIEIEADRLDQVETFLGIEGVDVILLDNMGPADLARAVAARDGKRVDVLLEASGGIDLDGVQAIAESGVDFVSVGALTHSVPSVDLGLDFGPADE